VAVAEFDGGPDGIPIGRALIVPPGLIHDELREAVRIVGLIHGDGVLPAIPLRMARLKRGDEGEWIRRGEFLFNPATGEPIAISVEIGAAHRVFAALHEIGHFLDPSAIGRPGRFASRRGDELADWREVVVESRAIAGLVLLRDDPSPQVDSKHVRHLLNPIELWARSYAQYVVNRGHSSALRASLDAFRLRAEGRVYYPQQWEDDDFGPIDEAIEGAFRRMGWRS
jgi:hypothetical protein